MDSDPYAPPTAPIRDRKPPSSALNALLVGLAIDFGGTLVFGTIVGFIYGMMLMSSNANPGAFQAALADVSPTSPVSVVMTAFGCGFSAFGGYVCSRMAQRRDFRLGVVLAASSSVLGFVLGGGDRSLAYTAVMVALTFASVLLGTNLAIAARTRDER